MISSLLNADGNGTGAPVFRSQARSDVRQRCDTGLLRNGTIYDPSRFGSSKIA
jgi:hypothetical protein